MKIGIDLGGTKTEIIVLNPTGDTVFRKRVDTPRDNYTKTIAMICDLVTEAKTSAKINKLKHIGIGIPGVISPLTGVIKNSNSTWLNGQTFREDLASSLGCEVRMANDANCMTLSEAVDGAGAGYNVVFAVILGTGCGAGITINGHILVGANAIGGEWGHNQLPWMDDHERDFAKSVNCYCGKYGCIEQFLSGSALANYYAYRLNTDKLFSSKEIITMADINSSLVGFLKKKSLFANSPDKNKKPR